MDLLIVRHAIAFERNAKRWPDDRARPLTHEGMLRARRAARGLKRVAERPACLLTSPLVRARQTAAILTESAGWPEALECAALAPGTSPEGLFAALHAYSQELIAIVGHQPGLGQFIARSLPGTVSSQSIELKKFGVAFLSFDADPGAGRATLRWLLAPGVLRAAR